MLAAAMAMMMVGCGKDDCEKAGDVRIDASKEACKGKSCWYCECVINQEGKMVDYDAEFKAVGCKDIPPASSDTPPVEITCEGKILDDAQECLDDKDKCKAPLIESTNKSCEGTPKS